MRKEIQSIDIVMENCEVIGILREDIGYFHISNIVKSISRTAVNSIGEIHSANEIFIEISSEANEPSFYLTDLYDGELNPFERLAKFEDITSIDINYKDGESENVLVSWGGDSEYSNKYQSSVVNDKTGDFYLVISPDKTASKYFDEQLSRESSATYWRMVEER